MMTSQMWHGGDMLKRRWLTAGVERLYTNTGSRRDDDTAV